MQGCQNITIYKRSNLLTSISTPVLGAMNIGKGDAILKNEVKTKLGNSVCQRLG